MGDTILQLGYPTLLDVANEYSSMDGGAQLLYAAKVLHRKCPLVQVLPIIKSNQIISHVGSRETYIGTAATRRFNEGVLPTDTKAAPFAEPIALYEDYGEVDKALWEIMNDPIGWRQQKDSRKIEGLTQGVEYDVFYANQAEDASKFNGLATRFKSPTYRPNGDDSWPYNVKLQSGTGSDLASIWILEFGEGKVYGICPKNVPAGLKIRDLGEVTKEHGSGKLSQVLRTHFQWYLGLVIEDERCVQRIANIETSGTTEIFSDDNLLTMKNNLPSSGEAPGTFIFTTRAIKTQMDIKAKDKSNGFYTQDPAGDIWGRPVTRFQGIPVMVAEKLLETETALT